MMADKIVCAVAFTFICFCICFGIPAAIVDTVNQPVINRHKDWIKTETKKIENVQRNLGVILASQHPKKLNYIPGDEPENIFAPAEMYVSEERYANETNLKQWIDKGELIKMQGFVRYCNDSDGTVFVAFANGVHFDCKNQYHLPVPKDRLCDIVFCKGDENNLVYVYVHGTQVN